MTKTRLSSKRFRFFGNPPGKRLSNIKGFPVALNPRRNKQGRTPRKNVRKIPKSRFDQINTIEEVTEKLFGKLRLLKAKA